MLTVCVRAAMRGSECSIASGCLLTLAACQISWDLPNWADSVHIFQQLLDAGPRYCGSMQLLR